jgi:hypothetical protein
VLEFDHLLVLAQEPAVDGSDLVDLLDGVALLEREPDIPDPFGIGRNQPRLNQFRIVLRRGVRFAGFERTDSLAERLLECSSNGHHLAH